MDFERITDGYHHGYTMPHAEYMDEKGLKYDDLSEHLKALIRVFEDKYDESLNDDGYLDEKEETMLLTESTKIYQEMRAWHEQKDKDDNGAKVATGVTLGLLGLIGLLLGINELRD